MDKAPSTPKSPVLGLETDVSDQTTDLIVALGARVSALESLTTECKTTLLNQQGALERLSGAVEHNQTVFAATLKLVEKNGTDAYREVISELREDMRTRMRWVLMAVSIGAAIAGGSNLIPTLEMLP